MTPVDQSIVDKGRGDCMRAAIASLFDLELVQVPHFILFKDWVNVYGHFLNSIGYQFNGSAYPGYIKDHPPRRDIAKYESVSGYFYAHVPSKTFADGAHAVIIDGTGLVVHDPNPNKRWLGINAIETGELRCWHIIERLSDGTIY